MDFKSTLSRYTRRRSFKYGVPFVIFVIGGSFGLSEFTALRFRYSKVTTNLRDELQERGVRMKPPGTVTLETEYEKTKLMDIDNWENVRIPRPWEEDGKEI